MTQQVLPHSSEDAAGAISRLNDQLRMTGEGGRTVLSNGVANLPPDQLRAVLEAVAGFVAFDTRNDPYGEHDCAIVCLDGGQVLWKVDYYDVTLTGHSLDPADPNLTCRILTIMLPEEY